MKLVFFQLFFMVVATPPVVLASDITRISFGSCLNQDKDLGILTQVLKTKPELFIFLGDNIYGDGSSVESLKQDYDSLGSSPQFKALRKEVPILATWDDHDYGRNDGGEDYPLKQKSEELFLDFFDVNKNSERRQRPGVYMDYWHESGSHRVHIIVLDTRYFRSPLRKASGDLPYPGRYMPHSDTTTTILGASQWAWLESKLKEPAHMRLIVSSIQVLHKDHGWEKWGNFPHELARLKTLVASSNTPTIFVSGDRHRGAIYKERAENFIFREITTSPMNEVLPGKYQIRESSDLRVDPEYFEKNFGAIEIDWERSETIINLYGEDLQKVSQLKFRHK